MKASRDSSTKIVLCSPIEGEAVELKQVNDPVFSGELMGKGVAIIPTEGKVVSPANGVVSITDSKHAIMLKTDSGCDIIIHIGLDTVNLKGEFFTTHIENDQRVKAGQLLVSFDIERIKAAGYDLITPIVVTEADNYQEISTLKLGFIKENEPLLCIVPNQELRSTTADTGDGFSKLGKVVVSQLGGAENIRHITHCATRLRVRLHDKKKANLEQIKAISGVLGAVNSMDGVQVIIGNNVNKVYDGIVKEYSDNFGSETQDTEEKASLYKRMLNMLSGIMGPVVPLILACGLLSALLVIAVRLGLNPQGDTYAILTTLANVGFYFLPIFLAYTAAKYFDCNRLFALFFGGVLLHPEMANLLIGGEGVRLFGIPVMGLPYESTLLPIILTVWVLSHVERLVERFLPSAIKFTFKPLLIVLIMAPLTLWIIAPAGAVFFNMLAEGMSIINASANWLALLLMSVLAPFIVITGMHLALFPMIMAAFGTYGFDNLFFVSFIGMNFSQFAVALAVMLKTKNPKLRQLASGSALTVFLSGVTEPTLFGITLRLKKPLIATIIGCLASGIFSAITRVRVFSIGAPSFFTMPIFMNPDGTNDNFLNAIIAVCIAVVVTFVATWILGFDDSAFEES